MAPANTTQRATRASTRAATAASKASKDSKVTKSTKPAAGLKKSAAVKPLIKKAAEDKGKKSDDFEEFPSSSEDEAVEDEFKGFDSTDDENDEDEISESQKEALQKKQLTEQEIKTKAEAAETKSKEGGKKNKTDEKGVVYVGRVPHGFFETEMQAYFSQFGTITRLRLSRNRKTGKSKHYAFIEFESSEIARVVAETMDNYLLFGHILKVKPVPAEQVHEKMFLGANKRFRVMPWAEIQKDNFERKRSQKEWDDKQKQEENRRAARQERLASMGIDFKY